MDRIPIDSLPEKYRPLFNYRLFQNKGNLIRKVLLIYLRSLRHRYCNLPAILLNFSFPHYHFFFRGSLLPQNDPQETQTGNANKLATDDLQAVETVQRNNEKQDDDQADNNAREDDDDKIGDVNANGKNFLTIESDQIEMNTQNTKNHAEKDSQAKKTIQSSHLDIDDIPLHQAWILKSGEKGSDITIPRCQVNVASDFNDLMMAGAPMPSKLKSNQWLLYCRAKQGEMDMASADIHSKFTRV